MYSSDSLDLDDVVAIDTHVHIEIDDHGNHSMPSNFRDAIAKYFKKSDASPDVDSLAAMYRERKMIAVVFTVDASTSLGHKPNSSEEIAEGAVFLCSSAARYITGTILDIDGGSQLGDATPRSLERGLA